MILEVLTSNTFGSVFYFGIATVTVAILWRGYYQNRFSSCFAYAVSAVLVLFTIFYVGYRFKTGLIPEKMAEETVRNAYYTWWVALHGTLSFFAIIQTCVIFVYASRAFSTGRNYFKEHPKTSLSLVILWPVAILFGMLI